MGHDAPLGFSPQFNVHHCACDQLLLLSETRSFRLTGDLYVHLSPLLDGDKSEAEIIEALKQVAPGAEIRKALAHMKSRGYVRPRSSAPSSSQSLWVEWEEEPEAVISALADWPVAVTAKGESRAADSGAAAELAATLADAGFPLASAKEARLQILLVDDMLQPDLEAFNREARQKGQSWIAFKPGGREAWLSPRFDPEGQRCWHCLSGWIGEHRPGDTLVIQPGRSVRPARGMLRATLEFARGQGALALTRMANGESDLVQHLLSFDSRSGGVEKHYVRVDPSCAVCGGATSGKPTSVQVPSLAKLTGNDRIAHQDGGWRVLSTAEARSKLNRLVSPITGVVPGLEDKSDKLGLPVVSAIQGVPRAVALANNRLVGRPGAASGKGASLEQAEVSCLAEALERYCTGFTGREARRRARMAELGETAVDPRSLLLFSDKQYANRETWNAKNDLFSQVPVIFDPEENIEWSPIYRLRDGAERWIPTRYAYFNHIDEDHPKATPFCGADSNGCASGAILSEAVLQGLLELIERDAFGIFWYNRLRRPAIDLDAFDDPDLQRARARYKELGRSLYALDLRNDLGIPVVVAISTNAEGGEIYLGLGAHLDASVAIARAVAEVNQVAVMMDYEAIEGEVDTDSTIMKWHREATLENQPYLQPLPGRSMGPQDFPQLCARGIGPALAALTEALESVGLEPMAMDLSWPDLDMACARVVVPGLRHFWTRFGSGRLYDVPVKLGWLETPTPEGELNPIPFFL